MGTSNQDCGVLFHCSSLEKFLEIHLVAVKKERGVELLYSRCCHPHQAFSLSLSCHRHKIFSLFPHTYLCTLRSNSLLRNNWLVKNILLRKNSCSFGICPNEGGGPAQIGTFSRGAFLRRGAVYFFQIANFKLFFRFYIYTGCPKKNYPSEIS